MVDCVVLIATVLNKVKVREVEVSELEVLLVDADHEVKKLVEEHKAVFETDVVLKVVEVERECLLEFGNKESKVKAMLQARCSHRHFTMVLVLVRFIG